MTHISECCFPQLAEFKDAIRDAFVKILNQPQHTTTTAILLAAHADTIFRSSKQYTERELDQQMNDIMDILRHLESQDMFEAMLRKDLAKRLLSPKHTNFDGPQLLIQKLKQDCGVQFTQKLEFMFKDLALNEDLSGAFEEFGVNRNSMKLLALDTMDGNNCSYGGTSGGKVRARVEALLSKGEAPLTKKDFKRAGQYFTARVLHTGNWPSFQPPSPTVNIPPVVAGWCSTYLQFYNAVHHSRRVTWQPQLGNAVLTAYYPDGIRREIHCTEYHALVLLQFNRFDDWTVGELSESTGIPLEKIQAVVMSLSNRVKILNRIVI